MHILQIINSLLIGGAEKLVVEASKKIIEKGHQVDILLFKTTNSLLEQEVLTRTDITVHFLSENTNIYNPSHILKIRKHLLQNKYDVVHVHLFPAVYWTALAVRKSFNGKLIHTEHNTKNRRMGNWFYRQIDNIIYRKYDCHIAISDAVRKSLDVHLMTKKSKVVNIYNGVNLETIASAKAIDREQLGLNDDQKILIQVSSFRKQKNQAILIKALERLNANVHLLLVGKGELMSYCESLAKELYVENRVHFLGVRTDVPQLLKTADIVILSSHYEGLSLASVEGLASGKPFIASNVPGLTEVVEGAGLLFPKNNSVRLAEMIDELFTDKIYYNKIVKDCMARSKKYDLNIMVNHYIELYSG
ncbi:Glycosyltransferase involved in cell wall bisynthesis [Pricia antarctica]|uniref:Glycosyltransferase involved in cell wall bisynthesis n=1 Tax=Pricia antarctica TaxID=641691 RepID=A0A1G7FL23_9FLAO|nr:glycosyltransferase [Pricia antarctica]SDE76583.1 Glycosyltransferase involved in cell wall bisynthesis [Pricia antarctica]